MPSSIIEYDTILIAICRELVPANIQYSVYYLATEAALEIRLSSSLPNESMRHYIRVKVPYETLMYSRDNIEPLRLLIDHGISELHARIPISNIKALRKKSRLPDWF